MPKQKEYLACFGEAPHFNHVHVHVVPRVADLPPELIGPRVAGALGASAEESVAADEVLALCEELQAYFKQRHRVQ